MGYYLNKLKEGTDPIIVALEADTYIDEVNHIVQNSLLSVVAGALGESSYQVNDACVYISTYKKLLTKESLSILNAEIMAYLQGTPEGFTTEWRDLLKELNGDPKSYSASTLEVPK